jgi:hypothetical protein
VLIYRFSVRHWAISLRKNPFILKDHSGEPAVDVNSVQTVADNRLNCESFTRTMALHHHIARHTKRYVSHVTKYLYERDTFFATIAVFVFLILFGMIPLNFYVLNPMKLALKDFDFNDIAYAKAHKG